MDKTASAPAPSFDTHPTRYRHWTLAVDGEIARLTMKVQPFGGADSEVELKSNSYDLAVDIELADAVQRLRFTHPQVKVCVITSGQEKIFCAGANIYMLASSSHPFKVNFCKFTNETRLAIEDASQNSGLRFLAACNGATAGGGYELALACDEIVLVDDGSSTVSLPEVPLLGVLPGTGGLTRVVDKRKVRRDLADAFSTLAEGVKGKRAVEWGLVDAVVPRSKFKDTIAQRARDLSAKAPQVDRGPGIELDEIGDYRHVSLKVDEKTRVAQLTVRAPAGEVPQTAAEALAKGAQGWALRMARELDHALLRLRFEHETVGLVIVRTEGDRAKADAVGKLLSGPEKDSWILRETRLLLARALRRLDVTARSFFAVVDEKSCFAGPLFELLVACDRSYVLDAEKVEVWPGPLSGGALPGWNGLSRLQTRFLAEPARADKVLAAGKEGPIDAATADKLGLATVFADEIDFEEELRVAVEERASLSPDALTGMEQNYRFAGPETLATKIFGRLSAWQNWIFIRPNATGENGALTMYGKPERPRFDFRRT
ncbi:MAG: benzoyl-CoA-dihydrodiol lyase [Deltaproteobacteria bacterium]|nr:MAG: benzoyl-CoA-dihydrodiol lyase [Deltaproteobacteria bacterium]